MDSVFLHSFLNPLSANPTIWSITLKQFAGKLPTNCLSVFDHFLILALKGLDLLELSPISGSTALIQLNPIHNNGP